MLGQSIREWCSADVFRQLDLRRPVKCCWMRWRSWWRGRSSEGLPRSDKIDASYNRAWHVLYIGLIGEQEAISSTKCGDGGERLLNGKATSSTGGWGGEGKGAFPIFEWRRDWRLPQTTPRRRSRLFWFACLNPPSMEKRLVWGCTTFERGIFSGLYNIAHLSLSSFIVHSSLFNDDNCRVADKTGVYVFRTPTWRCHKRISLPSGKAIAKEINPIT